MKEIFANGRRPYPLFQGGDGIAINDLLNRLYSDQHEVLAVGKIDNPDFRETAEQVTGQLVRFNVEMSTTTNERVEYKNPNSYNCILLKDDLFEPNLRQILETERPDIVLTQLNYSHRVIDIAHSLGIKTVLFIHDHHPFNYLTTNISSKVSHVFFNSESTRQHFGYLLQCPSSILYSPLDIERYKCDHVDPKYITMVNPTPDKGSAIMEKIIDAMPDQNFLIVSGWRGVPKEFHDRKNVTVVDRQYDMRNVYGRTKILLVPSQWEEAFGRVAVEAMVNRIPVIASNVGGLPEAVGNGGVLISDFVSPSAWIEATRQLIGDQDLQLRLGNSGYEHALSFDIDKIYAQFLAVLNTVHRM